MSRLLNATSSQLAQQKQPALVSAWRHRLVTRRMAALGAHNIDIDADKEGIGIARF